MIFNEIAKMHIPRMNNGTGKMTAKIYMDNDGKIILCSILIGASIGTHSHPSSDYINYILSENGKAMCDGKKEHYIRCILLPLLTVFTTM